MCLIEEMKFENDPKTFTIEIIQTLRNAVFGKNLTLPPP